MKNNSQTHHFNSPPALSKQKKKKKKQRGNHVAATSTRARATIADLGARFVRPGSTLLTHGHSRVVLALLRRAASRGHQFSVVVTEGRPDEAGLKMARALSESGIPVTVIIDSAVAWSLVS